MPSSHQSQHPPLLPTVDAILRSPFPPSDIFTSIPGQCLHATVLLLIRLIRHASARLSPEETHAAFVRLQIFPTAVLRRSLRGEAGWRTKSGQFRALYQRIRRAGSPSEWPASWEEAIAAHQARQQWYERKLRSSQASPRKNRRISGAMRLAAEAQYGCAMRSLINAPLAPMNDRTTQAKLTSFHPTPETAVMPLSDAKLRATPNIEESAVFRTVRSLHPHSAGGPDHMSPRLLHLIVTSPISPQAGVTGLSALTHLVRRLSAGNILEESIPLIAAATPLPLNPRPDKIRPIAIGQVLRRIVMKTLLPDAIEDSREFLKPLQKANGVAAGMDAIIHDARRITNRCTNQTDYVLISVDASDSFNKCSRQRFLEALPYHAPSLARFCNRIYASVAPPLVIPASPPHIIKSSEGTQEGDPRSMLLFSLATHELFQKIDALEGIIL